MTHEKRSAVLKNWMENYGRLVYSLAYKILLNAQDAEDVFQNTFSKAYFKMGSLERHSNVKAWLCRTAKNDALNKVSSSWKTKVALLEAPVELASSETDTTELSCLVKNLPPIYRKCIWLYYYAGYRTDEIAHLTGVAPSTVRTRLKRGREHLKADIKAIHGSENYEYR
jgi:RNA polymerase sigma-70 factor (ECF subfamily)